MAGLVPDVTFSNPLGVAYPSSRRDACEPIVDAYFDFLWWTDPSPNNDGYTQFPNGSFQFTATVTYQTFSIFGPQTHTATMEQPTTWTVNNVWVEDRTTYPGGRRKTLLFKPSAEPVVEQVHVRVNSAGTKMKLGLECRIYDWAGLLVKTISLAEVDAPGDASFTWDGSNAAGLQAPAGAYPYRVVVSPGKVPGDANTSAWVTISEFSMARAAYDPGTGSARIVARYSFATEHNGVQANPPCSQGRIDLYRIINNNLVWQQSVALGGDDLKPGTRTRWFTFSTGGVVPEDFLYVLELTDDHSRKRKARIPYRVLPRIAGFGYLPRAENFDYIYTDVRSNPHGFNARDRQLALKDTTFYAAFAAMNQPMSVVYKALRGLARPGEPLENTWPTAIFYFFGHADYRVGNDLYPMLICYEPNPDPNADPALAYTFIVHKTNLGIKLVQHGVDASRFAVLEQLPDGALNHMLLAVLLGCATAFNSPDDGNPAQGIVDKGAKAALGWTTTIYGQFENPERNWAQRWSDYFWQYACQGWLNPDTGNVEELGFFEAYQKAYNSTRDAMPNSNILHSGLQSRRVIPDGANHKILPARYKDSG